MSLGFVTSFYATIRCFLTVLCTARVKVNAAAAAYEYENLAAGSVMRRRLSFVYSVPAFTSGTDTITSLLNTAHRSGVARICRRSITRR